MSIDISKKSISTIRRYKDYKYIIIRNSKNYYCGYILLDKEHYLSQYLAQFKGANYQRRHRHYDEMKKRVIEAGNTLKECSFIETLDVAKEEGFLIYSLLPKEEECFALVEFDNGSPCDKGTLSEMEEIMKLAIKKEINLIKNERRKRQNARLLHASQNPQRYCRVIL